MHNRDCAVEGQVISAANNNIVSKIKIGLLLFVEMLGTPMSNIALSRVNE
jgi:hypothetical protein